MRWISARAPNRRATDIRQQLLDAGERLIIETHAGEFDLAISTHIRADHPQPDLILLPEHVEEASDGGIVRPLFDHVFREICRKVSTGPRELVDQVNAKGRRRERGLPIRKCHHERVAVLMRKVVVVKGVLDDEDVWPGCAMLMRKRK
jgi:hypothetical protein